MVTDRRLLVGAAGLALILAACGGASTATPAPATAAGSTPEPVATTNAATPAPAETEEPDVSLMPGAAGDLEALLPDQAGGLTFTKTSFDGSQLGIAGLGVDTGDLAPILEKYNKNVGDVRFAMATSTDSATPAIVMAFQLQGVPGTEMQELMTGGSDLTPSTIAGKQVLTTGAGPMGGAFYSKDDVAYAVILATPEALEEIIAALP